MTHTNWELVAMLILKYEAFIVSLDPDLLF